MAIFENSYVYCSRHGEYQPNPELIAESWYGWDDEDSMSSDDPRPAWITPEIIADGFQEDSPVGAHFIRLKATDEAQLMVAMESLFEDLIGDEPTGDDTIYDYYPSGIRLLESMLADLKEQANVDRGEAMFVSLENHLRDLELDEVLEVLDWNKKD